MSIFNKMVKAIDDCNLDDYLNLLHDNYVFVRHQSNQEVTKSEWIPVVTGMFNAMKEEKNLTLKITDVFMKMRIF